MKFEVVCRKDNNEVIVASYDDNYDAISHLIRIFESELNILEDGQISYNCEDRKIILSNLDKTTIYEVICNETI